MSYNTGICSLDSAGEQVEKCHRTDVADIIIGNILVQSPEKEETWGPHEICELLKE